MIIFIGYRSRISALQVQGALFENKMYPSASPPISGGEESPERLKR